MFKIIVIKLIIIYFDLIWAQTIVITWHLLLFDVCLLSINFTFQIFFLFTNKYQNKLLFCSILKFNMASKAQYASNWLKFIYFNFSETTCDGIVTWYECSFYVIIGNQKLKMTTTAGHCLPLDPMGK